MTKTGQWLADWMAEDGATDRLPDGWDDPHALVRRIETEAAGALATAAGEAHAYLHRLSGARFSDCPNEPCPARRAALGEAAQEAPAPEWLRAIDCPVCASGDVGHERAEGLDLPPRIIVDARGFYWRDYGDHYSMCPVAEDNEPVKPAVVYLADGIAFATPPTPAEPPRRYEAEAIEGSEGPMWQVVEHGNADEAICLAGEDEAKRIAAALNRAEARPPAPELRLARALHDAALARLGGYEWEEVHALIDAVAAQEAPAPEGLRCNCKCYGCRAADHMETT